MSRTNFKNNLFCTRNLVLMAVFSALATVLAYFPHIHIFQFLFPSPIMELEFSDIPVVIASYYLHPIAGVIVAFVKSVLHLPGTETAMIGELLSFVQAIVMILPMCFFRHQKKVHARLELLIKLGLGMVLGVLLGMMAGPLCVIPFLGGGINMEVGYFLWAYIVPFYCLRGTVIAVGSYMLAMALHRTLSEECSPIFLHFQQMGRTAKPLNLGEIYRSASVKSTNRLAFRFANMLQYGDVIELCGDLGAGKTTFTKGVAQALGINADMVQSPTFVLCRTYEGKLRMHHADLYRIESAEEAAEAGILEHIGDGIFIVEWADKIREHLPYHYVVKLEKIGDRARTIEVTKE